MTRRMPSGMSSGVIVSPRQTWTLKASSGTAPARPPRFQIPVRKLLTIDLMVVTHLSATWGSKTIAFAASRQLSSNLNGIHDQARRSDRWVGTHARGKRPNHPGGVGCTAFAHLLQGNDG